jgi:hypothetical protein
MVEMKLQATILDKMERAVEKVRYFEGVRPNANGRIRV